ncbi:MAG: DUF3035 domain-containing protein [Candidatus Paracaedibacteraceae bacterium]|nr:DUF3035 domain-containing protein [Candidatus Paracaedibacteraceae bacterium]
MVKRISISLLAAMSFVILTGCDTLRSTFGLDHYQADEFNIAENPPLSMPPSYHLAPPSANNTVGVKNAKKQADDNASLKVKKVLLGHTSKTSSAESTNAKAIVEKASAETKADPKIRETVNKEESNESTSGDGITDTISKMGKKIAANAKNTSEPTKKEIASSSSTTQSK